MLTEKETNRYARQIVMPEIGLDGQQKLKSAKVLVIGAGGLGAPVLQYLTAAGVGTIGICDGDKVDLSNLQRQILFKTDDVGRSKVAASRDQLQNLNDDVKFRLFDEFLDNENATKIISEFDFVIDGSDNFKTRYLVNDACVMAGKPFVFGSILKFEGQVSVFNFNNGPTYRCLYPEAPENIPSCTEAGVLGVLPGIIGALQANEAIKMIVGVGEILSGKLLIINALTLQIQTLEFDRNHYDEKFKIPSGTIDCEIESDGEISIGEFNDRSSKGEKFQLIDLRESYEKDKEIDDAHNIPFGEILDGFSGLDKNTTTILICTEGNRSKIACSQLKLRYVDSDFLSLKGGAKSFN